MFRRLVMLAGMIAPFWLSVPAQAGDPILAGGGTFAQILDGSSLGARTIITLVNVDSVAAPYTLSFYDDSGNPLTLSTTAGSFSQVKGTLNVGGSTVIQTNGANFVQGYAVLDASDATNLYSIAGSAVFGLTLPNGHFVEASGPLDTGLDYIAVLPFDNTIDPVTGQGRTGVALANSVGDSYQGSGTANIAVTVLDQTGNKILTDTITLPFGQHTLFLVDQKYPQTAGLKGTVSFVSTSTGGNAYGIKTLGVRATDTTYTSVAPITPCFGSFYFGYYLSGTVAGC